MNTQLIALEAELDLIKESFSVKYDRIISDLDKILNNWFISQGAVVTRRWIKTGFDEELNICFEIGFYNTEEQRIDFGSDVWVDFSSKTSTLRMNYGTCGYHTKSDIYQVMRAKLIAYVWENIDNIERELSALLAKNYSTILEFENRRFDIEREIRNIERSLKDTELKNIDESLKVNTTLSYSDTENMNYRTKLFSVDSVKIIKRTPKFIFATDIYNNEYKFKASTIVDNIYIQNMIVTEQE